MPKICVFDMPVHVSRLPSGNAVMTGPPRQGVRQPSQSMPASGPRTPRARFRYILTKSPVNTPGRISRMPRSAFLRRNLLAHFQLIGQTRFSVRGADLLAAQSGFCRRLDGLPEVLVHFKMFEVARRRQYEPHSGDAAAHAATRSSQGSLPGRPGTKCRAGGEYPGTRSRDASESNEQPTRTFANLVVTSPRRTSIPSSLREAPF